MPGPSGGSLPLAEVGHRLFAELRYFWEFLHDPDPITPEGEALFRAHRATFIQSWRCLPDVVFPNSLHYTCDHLIEDRRKYKSLIVFIGEGTEAAHARDGKLKGATLRGREKQAHDRFNTWELMIRNFAAGKEMIRQGVLDR